MKTVTDEALVKKREIIKKCLEEFRVKGLEKASVRDLCKFVGINSASMYFYFDSKDDVIIECVKYAIEKIDDAIKESFRLNLQSVDEVLNKLFQRATTNGDGVRFIAQVLSSPNHFKACRYEMAALHKQYGEYAKQISEKYGLSYKMFKPLFYMYLTLIYDYLVKGDEEYFKIQADAVLCGIEKMC